MYIILELEELRQLTESVAYISDPDVPIEATVQNKNTLERVTALLDAIREQQIVEDDLLELSDDQELLDSAMGIIKLIFSRLMIRDTFQWMRVIDQHGGLVICIKPGVKDGQLNFS